MNAPAWTELPPPMAWQPAAVEHLLGRRRAYLGDEPGLGKTLSVAYAWQRLGRPPILVLCPAIAVEMWKRVLYVASKGHNPAFAVVSYDSYKRDPTGHTPFGNTTFGVLVLDEAHKLGGANSQRTQTILGSGAIARSVDRVWLLSGTPMPKHPGQMWPVLAALFGPELLAWMNDPPDGGRLPVGNFYDRVHYDGFLNRSAVYQHTEHGIRVFGMRDAEDFKRLLFGSWNGQPPLMLARAGLVDVPVTWDVLPLDLVPADAGDIRFETDRVGLYKYELTGAPFNTEDASVSKLRRLLGQAKVEPYVKLRVMEHDVDPAPRVIFTHHQDVTDAVVDALRKAGHRVSWIDGRTTPKQRQIVIDNFQAGAYDDIVLGIMTAQTAITLTRAAHVDLLEPSWNADHNIQAVKRVHRLSQTRAVRARLCAAAGTLDDALLGRHLIEARMQSQVFDTELLAPAAPPARRRSNRRETMDAQSEFR